MPAFSAFSRTGPIALFALSLSAFVPVAGFAQETPPEIVEPVEPPVATEPTPADIIADAMVPDAGLADGRLSIAGAADIEVSIATDDTATVWATLAHPEFPDLPHTAVMVAHPGADTGAITAAVMDQFNEIDSVAEGEHLGTPVWVITGAASRRPDGDRPVNTYPRAQIMVTQACLPDGGPAVFGVVTTQMRAAPVVLDVILSTLTLSMPDDAAACADEIGAAVMALPIGEIDHPEPTVDLGSLVEHERFGIRLLTPEGMRVRRDTDGARGQEYWLTSTPEGSSVGSDVTMRVSTLQQRNEISTMPIDSPEFAEVLSQLTSVPLAMTEETTQLGSTTLSYFRGSAIQEHDGVTGERRLLLLINEQPTPAGLSPWIAIVSFDQPEAEAIAFEQQIIEGLALIDTPRYEGFRVQSLLADTVRIAMMPGQRMANLDDRGSLALMSLADAPTPTQVHSMYAVEGLPSARLELVDTIARRLPQITEVSEGHVDGVPVWIFDGGSDRLPSQELMPEGQTSPARIVVTQLCAPGDRGPLLIGILATQERLAEADFWDGMMAPVRVSMPERSTACPAEFSAALSAITATGAAPQPQQQDEPPVAIDGKPGAAPMVTVDPEAANWAEASAIDTMHSMMAYLRVHPQGAHAAEARERLAELTAPPPPADPEMQAWADAEAAGTLEAMWTYLKAYPQGMHARLAQEALRGLTQPQPAPAPPAPSKRG